MLRPILLVEDNPNDLELTLFALEKIKLANEVIVTRDGEEALDYLLAKGRYAGRPEGNPALVLLDLKLPKIDGVEVLHRMRNMPSLATVPVVMFTSSSEEKDVAATYAAGINSYVVKPIDFNAFVSAVSQLGVYWSIINEPPLDVVKAIASETFD